MGGRSLSRKLRPSKKSVNQGRLPAHLGMWSKLGNTRRDLAYDRELELESFDALELSASQELACF